MILGKNSLFSAAMAFEYLWHSHPIQLSKILTDSEARCFMCLLPVTEYNFRCTKCKFFIHRSCLELPLQARHPLHQDHPLTLLETPPSGNGSEVMCNDCGNPASSGFTYHCPTCQYNLHLQCATRRQTFKYDIHKHPLAFCVSPPHSEITFRCFVCGDTGRSFCLHCSTCKIAIHVECAALPISAKIERHEHPFTLTITRSIEENSEEAYCDVCEEMANLEGCLYYCARCKYGAHLGCAGSAPNPQIKFSYKNAEYSSAGTSDELENENQSDRDDPLKLQSILTDDVELIKLRSSFAAASVPQTSEENESTCPNEKQNLAELKHFSHNHSLTLSDEHKNEKICCHGCLRHISGLAYSCTECKFFLHKWCAELPLEIKHPLHSLHSLTLLAMRPFNCYQCEACDNVCEGFIFNCKPCNFSLHVECASIPSTFRSEVHEHLLTLRPKKPYSTRCKACGAGDNYAGATFHCDKCSLDLDFNCALLPRKIRHRRHMHSFTLTDTRVEENSDEYYCDICEEQRDPNNWVYYCEECKYVGHISCATSELFEYVDLVKILQHDHHEHLLNLITKSPFTCA